MFVRMLRTRGIEMKFERVAELARGSEDTYLQLAAIQLLSRLCPEEARDAFRSALRGESERLARVSAAQALARLHDEEGLAALKGFFREARPPEDLDLARRLAEVGELDGYSLVVDATRDESAPRRVKAAGAVLPFIALEVETGEESAMEQVKPTELLFELARDVDAGVQIRAIRNFPSARGYGLSCFNALDFLNGVQQGSSPLEVVEEAERMYSQIYTVCRLHNADGVEDLPPAKRLDVPP
jgi:hypothetical protein